MDAVDGLELVLFRQKLLQRLELANAVVLLLELLALSRWVGWMGWWG